MFKRVGFAVVVGIVVITFCGLAFLQDKAKDDEKYELRYKFKEGQKWTDTMKATTKTTEEIPTNVSIEIDQSSEVKSIDKEGVATVENSFKKIKASGEMMGQKVEFDSEKKEENGNDNAINKAITKKYKEMLDKKVESKIYPSGKIETIKKKEGDQDFSDPGSSLACLPKEKVKVGDKWTNEDETGSGGTKVKIKVTGTLEKIEELDKKKCAVIKYDIEMSTDKDAEQQVSGKGSMIIYFSLEEGIPLKITDGKFEIKTETEIAGKKKEMNTTTEFEHKRKVEEEKKEEKK